MPSIAPAPDLMVNVKKRRRDDDYSPMHTDGSAMSFEMQIEMKLAASPHMARHEITAFFDAERMSNQRRHHLLPRPRRDVSKRLRQSGAWKAVDDGDNVMDYKTKEVELVGGKEDKKIDLSPCHICHRKPSEKRELDDYAHCEGCGRRTCYVCIRQCEGPGEMGCGAEDTERDKLFGIQDIFSADGTCDAVMFSFHSDEMMCIERPPRDSRERKRGTEHRGKVCSRCCVERGSEGDVWCFGCLRVEGD